MGLKKQSNKLVGVIGAGSFGTTVANLVTHNTAEVLLYVRNSKKAAIMQQTRMAMHQHLAANITITQDLATIAANCKVIFLIVPATSFRAMMQQLAPFLKPHHLLIHGTKGLDVYWPNHTTRLPVLSRAQVKTMSEVIQEECAVQQIGCLAGPNLASEVAQGQPAATVLASRSEAVITQGTQLLQKDYFQVYGSKDLLGVELCGTLKNIIAIGAGLVSGLGYGNNTKGLLISQGIVEMAHIGKALGTRVQPFMGLAGIGDLVATCTSSLSRNYTLGYRLAQGETLHQILQSTQAVTEGIHTVKAIRSLMAHYHLRAPITEMTYQLLFEDLSVQEAIQYFMKQPLHPVSF